MIFNDKFLQRKTKRQTIGLEIGVVTAGGIAAADWKYQRRTQKGMGRTEKTVHNGAAKNPRWLKACNITRGDMCEFFFISMRMKLL
jgi:hypothetical protein